MISRNVVVLREDEVTPLVGPMDAKLIREKCDQFLAKMPKLRFASSRRTRKWTQAQKDEAWLDHMKYVHACRTGGVPIRRWNEF